MHVHIQNQAMRVAVHTLWHKQTEDNDSDVKCAKFIAEMILCSLIKLAQTGGIPLGSLAPVNKSLCVWEEDNLGLKLWASSFPIGLVV